MNLCDIALEGRVARTMLRIGASHARHVVDKETKKIRQQMRSKRGRQARVRKTLGQSKEQWMHQIGKTKAHSALLTQLRTGKIGFNEFLCERRVPGVWNKRCACGHAAMSVRHVLLSCPRDIARDLKEILGTKHGATAAISAVVQTDIPAN